LSFASGVYGESKSWIGTVHVTNQARVVAAIRRLFAAEPQAGPVEELDDGVILRIDAEGEDDLAPSPLPGVAPQRGGDDAIALPVHGIAVVDDQLVFSSDYVALRKAIEEKDEIAAAKLRRNEAYRSLAIEANGLANRANGRMFVIGNEVSTIPPLIPKYMARFHSDPPFVYRTLQLMQRKQSAALTLRKTKSGLQVDGLVITAPPEL
jgi:hypothetical protein